MTKEELILLEKLPVITRNPEADKSCIENLLLRGDALSLYAVKMIKDAELMEEHFTQIKLMFLGKLKDDIENFVKEKKHITTYEEYIADKQRYEEEIEVEE